MSYKLNETIRRTLSLSNIKPTISDSLVFQMTDKKGKSTKELIDNELIDAHKIILYIYGKCIEYHSAYIYQFDVHFAVIDKKYSQALLYSTPRHSVMGIDTIIGINRAFGRLMDDAVSDYLSANEVKSR